MNEERQIDVGLWSAAEDTRAVEVAGQLASLGIIVHDLDITKAKPMAILLLPGDGGRISRPRVFRSSRPIPRHPRLYSTPRQAKAPIPPLITTSLSCSRLRST